jgi:hypothetical protein
MPVFGLFISKVYADPKLPYLQVVTGPDKSPKSGYSFAIPDAYIGDPSGCNETKRDSIMHLDFD